MFSLKIKEDYFGENNVIDRFLLSVWFKGLALNLVYFNSRKKAHKNTSVAPKGRSGTLTALLAAEHAAFTLISQM